MKVLMKRLLSILISFTVILSATGCKAAKRELETLAVVVATGFDLTAENKYLLTVQILNPQKESGGGMGTGKGGGQQATSDVIITSSIGVSPMDAIQHMSTTLGRELYLSHTKYTVIGENLAKSGMALYIDFAFRGQQTRPDIPLLVAKGKASDIVTAVIPDEKIPATKVERLIKSQSIIGYAPYVKKLDFAKALSSKSKSPIAGVIDLKDKDDTVNRLNMSGTAVFNDDKLVGYLTEAESRGMNWIRGKVKGGSIASLVSDNEKITFNIIRSSSKIIPKIDNDNITIDIVVKEDGDIREMTGEIDPMKNPKLMDELSEVQNKAIEDEIKFALHKAQKELDADIFGFADSIYKSNPKTWKRIEKRWKDIFPYIKVNVKVKSSLKSPGLTSKPTK